MKSLIIDTSTDCGLIGIAEAHKLLTSRILSPGNQLSKLLLPAIEQLAPLKDLAFIAVGRGPGSYTGTRVGAAVAKSLAFALDIPLIGFCSLAAFLPFQKGTFASILPSKKGGVFLLKGQKDDTGMDFSTMQLVSLEELPALSQGVDFFISKDFSPNLASIAQWAYDQFLKENFCPHNTLDLIYLH